MENLGIGFDGGGGGDLTVKGCVATPWPDSSSIRRRRLSSPSPSAFLTPAFDACAALTPRSSSSSGGSSGGGSLDFDASLLRYTRSSSQLSPSESSDLTSSDTRRRLHRLLQLRSSLSSLPPPSSRARCSSISPLSPIQNILPARSPPMYMTPVKVELGEDVVVMDGVLVSDAGSRCGRAPYKTEVCRLWDENGICRYGSKCQFVHGKEKMHGARPAKHKSELSGRNLGRSRSPFYSLPSAVDPAASEETSNDVAPPASTDSLMTVEADFFKLDTDTLLTVEADCNELDIPCGSPPRSVEPQLIQDEEPAVLALVTASEAAPYSMTNLCTAKASDEELVDGFLSSQRSGKSSFQWPVTEDDDVQNQITKILYGPSQRRRLPVFTEFCPEHVEERSGNDIENVTAEGGTLRSFKPHEDIFRAQ